MREARLARRLLGREASGSACPPAGRISALATPALLCPLSPSEFLLGVRPSVRRACQGSELSPRWAPHWPPLQPALRRAVPRR